MFQRLKEDITCVFERDPAARNYFEVLTSYPEVHALIFHRMNHWLWRHKMRWLARFLSVFARLITGIEIHPGASIGRRFLSIMAWVWSLGRLPKWALTVRCIRV